MGPHNKLLRRRGAGHHRIPASGNARSCPFGAGPSIAVRIAHAQRANGPGFESDRRHRSVWGAAAQGRAIGARQTQPMSAGLKPAVQTTSDKIFVCPSASNTSLPVLGGSDGQARLGGQAGRLIMRITVSRGVNGMPSWFGVIGVVLECKGSSTAHGASRQGRMLGTRRPRQGASALAPLLTAGLVEVAEEQRGQWGAAARRHGEMIGGVPLQRQLAAPLEREPKAGSGLGGRPEVGLVG